MIAGLPDITFANKDEATVKSEVISGYEKTAERTLAPGDPIRLFLESIAAIIIQQRAKIDFTGKMNLLSYAVGDYLDHLGAFTQTPRLSAASAVTTLRFTLSSAQIGATIIPIGTRASADGQIFFATTKSASIPEGQLYVDVSSECQTPGTIGNDIIIGAINTLVDTIPYVESVTNLTITSGGADIESNDNYRERIHQAPEKFSVAGPEGAYIYYAKSTNQSIIDVSVDSPKVEHFTFNGTAYVSIGLHSHGVVNVYLLMDGGELPTTDIINEVQDTLSALTVRPLTDNVTVSAPEQVVYNINLTYYIDEANTASETTIKAEIETAISDYVLWQKSKIGRDITPSDLIARIMNAGAKRVNVISPTYQALEVTQVAGEGTISAAYGGLEQ